MKFLLSPAVLLLASASLGSAAAQDSSTLSSSSIQPLQVTCQQLLDADASEQLGLAFFLAGYSHALESRDLGGSAASGADLGIGSAEPETSGDTSSSLGAETPPSASAMIPEGAASDASSPDTAASGSGAMGATDPAPHSSSGLSSGTASDMAASDPLPSAGPAIESGSDMGGTTPGSADIAASDQPSDPAADTSAGLGDSVAINREFFAMSADEILQGCEDDPGMMAHEVISEAETQ